MRQLIRNPCFFALTPLPCSRVAILTTEGAPQRHLSAATAEAPPHDNPASASSDGLTALRTQLLDRALHHVQQYGWTHASLVQAARDLNLSPAVTGILPRGEGELVEHHLRSCNLRLSAVLEARAAELASLPDTRQRLALALRLRLEMLAPHINSWPQALSVASRPSNLPHSLQLLTSMVDAVWHSSGASSSDSSWYSQRAMLAAVYACSELYMVTDYSPGFQETWQALDRRIGDMLAVGKAAGSVEGMGGEMMAALAALQAAARSRQQPAPQEQPPQQQQQQQQQQPHS